jgi:hypothetical protein
MLLIQFLYITFFFLTKWTKVRTKFFLFDSERASAPSFAFESFAKIETQKFGEKL